MAYPARRSTHAPPPAPPAQTGKVIAFDKFAKMNTQSARQNLQEQEAGWIENLQPIAPNNLKVVPGAAPALTTISGKTVSREFPANYGGTDYVIFFAIDGSATQVNALTGAQVTIAGPGTFSTVPDMTVYSSARLLIMDATSGYATWDGTLFVGSGGISPNIQVTAGGTYAATPAVSFSGGAGSGATAHAVMGGAGASQFVAAVVLDTEGTGYKATDVITVNFTLGGGATATARVWPQVTGTTIAVFAGRVWWGNGRILNFTGTAGYDDVNPANAAGSTTITDNDLAHVITALRSLNNYLYIFGDQSVRQIGSVTVSSSITLFTPLTLASDIGTSFMMTIQSYNRLVLFANKNGVYGIFGASIQKISNDLDGIFQLTDFSLQPSAAINDLTNIHCYLLLLKYLDPVLGSRSIIVIFQQDKWFVVSQGALLAICSIPLGSTTQVETFGSSGADVTQLLQNTSAAVPITLKTALTSHGNLILAKQAIRAGVAATSTSAQSFQMLVETENSNQSYTLDAASVVNWVNNSGGIVQWQNNTPANVTFIGGGYRFPYSDVDGYGKVLGATITGTVMNFALNAIAIEYREADLWGLLP